MEPVRKLTIIAVDAQGIGKINKSMITNEQKDILNQYAQLKKDINVLDNKAEGLKEQVLEIMQDNEVGEIAIGNDKLSIGSRRAWKYTPQVKELKKALDERKKYEEQTGVADYTENFYPIFSDSDNKKEKNYD